MKLDKKLGEMDKGLNKKRKRHKVYRKMVRYLIGYPIHIVFVLPTEYVKSKYLQVRDLYYLNREQKIKEQAVKELKEYILYELYRFKGVYLSDEKMFQDDNHIVSTESFFEPLDFINIYGAKGTKKARIYGELFGGKVIQEKSILLNDLVLWLTDLGCNVTYKKVFLVDKNDAVGVLDVDYTR